MDSAEAVHHMLRHQIHIAEDTLGLKEERFSALATDYYRLINGPKRRAFDTNEKRGPKRGVPLTPVERSPFIKVVMARMKIMVLSHNSVAVAVVHIDIHQTYVSFGPTCPKNVF